MCSNTLHKFYCCGKCNFLCSHLLGQQHQSQRLLETEQTDKEGWLCAGDCTGAPEVDSGEKDVAQVCST